ncbi:MAG: hypothetical protein MJZ33_06430 [Paludibacteraceae bacterium]|nr:hypothetical protein [Paludibacteraceae bacterium]
MMFMLRVVYLKGIFPNVEIIYSGSPIVFAKKILHTEAHTRFTYPFSKLELRVRRYSKELYEELEKYVKS